MYSFSFRQGVEEPRVFRKLSWTWWGDCTGIPTRDKAGIKMPVSPGYTGSDSRQEVGEPC